MEGMNLMVELNSYLSEWRKKTGIPEDIPIEIQIGDLSELRHTQGVDEDHIGVTMSQDNKQFILAFDEEALERCEQAKREHILIHELMHANLCFFVGDDPIEQMEAAVDTIASLMLESKRNVTRIR